MLYKFKSCDYESFKTKVLKDKTNDDDKARFYKRFIDDMLAAFMGTEQEANGFVEWMNTLWPGVKFTYDWSNKELTYLDVNLIMAETSFETDRYIKPTNPQLFLHYESNHPKQVFKAIVYGQAITVKTICSKEEFVVKHFDNLRQKFEERGYPLELVEQNLSRGAVLNRADLLTPKPPYPTDVVPTIKMKRKFKPIFIITYNPHNPDLRSWVKENYFILQADRKMVKVCPRPPLVVYRQSPNLQKHLVRTRFRELPHRDGSDQDDRPAGCYKHQHSNRGGGNRCKLCVILNVSTHFTSNLYEV